MLVNTEAVPKELSISLNGKHTYSVTNEYIWSDDPDTRSHPDNTTPPITNRTHVENIKPILEDIGMVNGAFAALLRPYSINAIKLSAV
jgi:hypothetical protein